MKHQLLKIIKIFVVVLVFFETMSHVAQASPQLIIAKDDLRTSISQAPACLTHCELLNFQKPIKYVK